eukprot:10638841-Alexandrium_andersonii.AAC.1
MVAQGYDAGWGSPFFPLASPPIEQLNNSARPLGELWGFARNKGAYVSDHLSSNNLDVALRSVQSGSRLSEEPMSV